MGPVLGTLSFADIRRRVSDELLITGNEILIFLMHAHVNEMIPKTDHNINVTGHLYFLFSVAENNK